MIHFAPFSLVPVVRLALLCFCIMSSSITAQAAHCVDGTWRGTIGQIPVSLEFGSVGGKNDLDGRYYYRANLEDLVLIQQTAKLENSYRWKEFNSEQKETGILTAQCQSDRLQGDWRSVDGTKKMDFIAVRSKEGEYHDARFKALKIDVNARKKIGGHSYEVIRIKSQDTVNGVRLVGTSQAIGEINQHLHREFTLALDHAISCDTMARVRENSNDAYESNFDASVIEWNERWVVVNIQTSGYCGGAHPYGGSWAKTYSMQEGGLEDTALWLSPEFQKNIALKSPLGKLFLKRYRQGSPDRDECISNLELAASSLWPTSKGMVLQPWLPHVAQACIEEVTIPYQVIMPYLSPQGKDAVKSFIGHGSTNRK